MRTGILLATLAASQFACLSASAQGGCPFDASSLAGNQVYYIEGNSVLPLASASVLEGRTRAATRLYYVVRAESDRSGAIVIKSARLGMPLRDDDPRSDRLAMKRDATNDRCAPDPGAFLGSVSTRAYSEYHDYGQDSGEYLRKLEGGVQARQIIKKFHTAYTWADGNCRKTDAKTRPDGTYEARSNRSQFSFDTTIVDYGFNSAAYNIASATFSNVASYFFPPAFAEPQKLRERTIEIRHYRTQGGVACVPFQIQVRGQMQSLRLNDLENRPAIYGQVGEFRLGPTFGATP